MEIVTIGKLLVLFLPFLLSLAAQGGTPKVIGLATAVLALWLSAEPDRAVVPWAIGMAISVLSVHARMHQLRAAGVRQLK